MNTVAVGIICGKCGGQIGGSDYFKLRDEVWHAANLSGVRCKKCADETLGHAITCADLDPTLPWWGMTHFQPYFDGLIQAIAGRTPEQEGLYIEGFGLGKMVAEASTPEQRRQFLRATGQPGLEDMLAAFQPYYHGMVPTGLRDVAQQRGLRDIPRGPGTGRP